MGRCVCVLWLCAIALCGVCECRGGQFGTGGSGFGADVPGGFDGPPTVCTGRMYLPDPDSGFPPICLQCPPGSYCENGKRFPCPAGTYQVAQSAPACNYYCPPHSTSPPGSKTSLACVCDDGYVRVRRTPANSFDRQVACVADEPPKGGVAVSAVADCCSLSVSLSLNDAADALVTLPDNQTVVLDPARILVDVRVYEGHVVASEDAARIAPAGKQSSTLSVNGTVLSFPGLKPLSPYTLWYRVHSAGATWTADTVTRPVRTMPPDCASDRLATAPFNSCPAGSRLQNCSGTCVACPAGTFRATSGALTETACRMCPADTYSRANASSCTPATPGACRALPGSLTAAPVCWDSPEPQSALFHIPGVPRATDAEHLPESNGVVGHSDDSIGHLSSGVALPVIYGAILLASSLLILWLIYMSRALRRGAAFFDVLYRQPDRDVTVTSSLGVPTVVPSTLRSAFSVIAFFAVLVLWAFAIHDFTRNRYVEERSVVTLSALPRAYEPVQAPRIVLAVLGTSLECASLNASVRALSVNIFGDRTGAEAETPSLYSVSACEPIGTIGASPALLRTILVPTDDTNCRALAEAAGGAARCLVLTLDPSPDFFVTMSSSLLLSLAHRDGVLGPWLYAQTLRVRIELPSWLPGEVSWATVSNPLDATPPPSVPPGFGVSSHAAFQLSRALLVRPNSIHRGYELVVDGRAAHIPDPVAAAAYAAAAKDDAAAPTPPPLGVVFALNMASTVVQVRQVETISGADLATRLVSYAAAAISTAGVCASALMQLRAKWKGRFRMHSLDTEAPAAKSLSDAPIEGSLVHIKRKTSWGDDHASSATEPLLP